MVEGSEADELIVRVATPVSNETMYYEPEGDLGCWWRYFTQHFSGHQVQAEYGLKGVARKCIIAVSLDIRDKPNGLDILFFNVHKEAET